MRQLFVSFFLILGLLHCGEKNEEKDVNEKQCTTFEKLDFVGSLCWITNPGVGMAHENVLELIFKRKKTQDAALSVADLKIWPYMKIHGHGGARKTIITELPSASLDERKYRVSGFRFTMPGPWEIEIRAVIDGIIDSLSIDVEVP